ncbi:MAG: hypothetical protein WBV56_07425, partial [Azonexus sp.]
PQAQFQPIGFAMNLPMGTRFQPRRSAGLDFVISAIQPQIANTPYPQPKADQFAGLLLDFLAECPATVP